MFKEKIESTDIIPYQRVQNIVEKSSNNYLFSDTMDVYFLELILSENSYEYKLFISSNFQPTFF